MATYINSFFETRLQHLLALAEVIERAFASAGLEYRVIGGLAAYLYVEEQEPDAGRLTKDIDIIVRREDLAAISKAVEPFGLQYRHASDIDKLVQTGQPSTRRAAHMIFGEPGTCRILQGVRLTPPEDLIRMQLASFQLDDEVNLKDLDEAGVITPEIESTLSPLHHQRLEQVRAR